MKEFIRCTSLFASCGLLITLVFCSCTQFDNDRSQLEISKPTSSKKVKQYPSVKADLETLCLFAASELDRLLDYARSKEALLDSRFLLMAEEVHQKIGKEEDLEEAKAILRTYLDSPIADKDIKRLSLGANFKSSRLSNLHHAKDETELLSSIIDALRRVIFFHMEETMYNRFDGTNRIPHINGNILTLKRNKIYRFPTMLFINNNFIESRYKFKELEPLWINTAELEGTFDTVALDIKTHNGMFTIVTKTKMYVRLIE